MLEFCKKVLSAVSFNPHLFRKELKKAKERLGKEEREQLKHWSRDVYGTFYRETIEEVLGY